MSWIAEDVPWYSVDKSVKGPWRDEDVAMSAPRKLGKYDTEDEARAQVARELELIASYRYIKAGGESDKFVWAAETIRRGVDGIRISGRYYRVREES
jgi:hypothetical protein